MKRWILTLAVVGVTSSAFAHVTVWPRESTAGAIEKYLVRVPTEGKVATTSAELDVPDGVAIMSIEAPAGWQYEVTRSGDRITKITWKMEIKPGEYREFAFIAQNPKQGSPISWKARQHFADGTSDEWVGPAGSQRPAPVTRLVGAATK